MGGLVMMRSTPARKARVKSAGEIVRASTGRWVSHPSVASKERRRGCRLCSRPSLCVVAVCALGSRSVHVYEATTWLAFMIVSSHVAMPPPSSTRWMCLWGRMHLGMDARGEDEGVS